MMRNPNLNLLVAHDHQSSVDFGCGQSSIISWVQLQLGKIPDIARWLVSGLITSQYVPVVKAFTTLDTNLFTHFIAMSDHVKTITTIRLNCFLFCSYFLDITIYRPNHRFMAIYLNTMWFIIVLLVKKNMLRTIVLMVIFSFFSSPFVIIISRHHFTRFFTIFLVRCRGFCSSCLSRVWWKLRTTNVPAMGRGAEGNGMRDDEYMWIVYIIIVYIHHIYYYKIVVYPSILYHIFAGFEYVDSGH